MTDKDTITINTEKPEENLQIEVSPLALLNSLVRIESKLNDIEKWYKRINIISICATAFITILLLTITK